ncbi:MAG TPA: CpaF family protein [Clostridiales bacterium]|jgi:pilus assembly protein CpaF|nr:CpaF family protein [Clostridiales bacterium]
MSLLDRLENQKNTPQESTQEQNANETSDQYLYVKRKIHTDIIDSINRRGKSSVDREEMRKLIQEAVQEEENGIPRIDRIRVAAEIFNDILGYGPIEELLDNPEYSEVMVNGPKQVYVESHGKLTLTGITFRDDAHVTSIIDRIVSQIGRHVDEASPMVDARLPDGSRVNAIIPPLSLVGPVLTIRKFGKIALTAQKLIEFGSLSPKMLAFLEACVKGKLNIIVAGGTGSGKTTLLNVLSSYIPADERIITIEDAAELQLKQDHVVTLEARPANLEGKGAITIRSLVKNALRMRPDRIIVGEVRSEETLDMLQAMNTGHDGSLTTIHANTPRDTLSRIETMVMMSGMELPHKAIRDQVASAIDIIIQQTRLRDGTRKITNITEITGMEGDVVSMQDLFVYDTEGKLDSSGKFKGEFRATGVRPHCIEKIKQNGVPVNIDWFTN